MLWDVSLALHIGEFYVSGTCFTVEIDIDLKILFGFGIRDDLV